jgi:putative aldouronate transport system permease protein
MAIRKSADELVLSLVAYVVMALLAVVTLYPLLNVLSLSLTTYEGYVKNPAMVFPRVWTLASYQRIFSTSSIMSGYRNTIFVTVTGTAISILLTILTAYPLAKRKIRGSRFFVFFIILTMLFQAGMIPSFLIVKSLGLLNSLWAVILCQALTPFNFLIMRASMEAVPDSLEESVRLDGGGPLTTLFMIVLPLCLPVVVALVLFYAVAHWNRFFEAVLYINSRSKWTMSLILREIITEDPNAASDAADQAGAYIYPKMLQNATIIVTIIPIMLVYPLIQRYFISGVMIGAVKE